ncbi:MAG TPA: FAD-dependent monooxygenase, partial [Pseudolabrys sp.]|nr:FAD-dependent monooxygenase [Pseudolabrys sp.]
MMNIAERARAAAPEAVQAWLGHFQTALQDNDAAAAAELFLPDGLWRDLLAFTWTIQTITGRAAIEREFAQTLARIQPRDFHIPQKRTPPRWVTRAGTECIEAIVAFETAFGPCNGVLRLVPDGEGRLRAWTLNTNLHELRGHEEEFKGRSEPDSTRDFGAENWADRLARQRAFADRDPTVLVIGGGQAGLSIAARLGQLGIDTLIVDRHARVGDNWRTRYHSLTLHNEV